MVKIFVDGADLPSIEAGGADPEVHGFTTNPTIMRKAGVVNYMAFARDAVRLANDKPISFEVFADEEDTMEAQARILARLGSNVFVKLPITNTQGYSTNMVMRALSLDMIKLNVTAVFTIGQIATCLKNLYPYAESIISIFAGRIHDTGRSVTELFQYAKDHKKPALRNTLWASPRQVFDIVEAEAAGADIITVTPDLLAKKRTLFAKGLEEYSLDTVKMFYEDAQKAGYTLQEDLQGDGLGR